MRSAVEWPVERVVREAVRALGREAAHARVRHGSGALPARHPGPAGMSRFCTGEPQLPGIARDMNDDG